MSGEDDVVAPYGSPEWVKEVRGLVEGQADSDSFNICFEDAMGLIEVAESKSVEITKIKAALEHLREAAVRVADRTAHHEGGCHCLCCELAHAVSATGRWDKKP